MSAFRTLHRSVLVLFAVVIIAIVTLVHFSISKMVAEQARAQQSSMSPAIALIVEQLLKPLHISEALGKSRELIDIMNADEIDEAQVFGVLGRMQEEFGMTFFVANENNRMQYNSDGTSLELIEGEVSWYFKYKEIDDDEVADIGKWEDPHFYIDLKMYNDNGRFLGFFGIGKSLASFIEIFEKYKASYGYDFLFVDPEGKIMLSSDPNLMADSSAFHSLADLAWFQALPEDIQSQESLNNQLVTINNKDHLVAEVELEQFDWTVYLISPLDQRQTEISNGFIFSVVTLLITVFALFIMIYNLLYYYRKGVKQTIVVNAVNQMLDKRQTIAAYNRLSGSVDSMSIILVDIDHFAKINDTYGRSAGDEVLLKVSRYLKEQLIDDQLMGRWSSDVFIILLPKIGPTEATKMANNFRHGIATLPVSKHYPDLTLTASFGVSYSGTTRPILEVTAHAEDALYQARRDGRNKVCVQLID
ncbi:GGDEF domain-containing protein [Alteromonas sediminis]|uniref:diguanylate cyclase n=1 Tax=Alteromonas sediminis TaxID=2259342 RepID=A0A3N5YBV0_9ALTE|nr:GGDEF domain-containing protein [Alteromonas sediminis]